MLSSPRAPVNRAHRRRAYRFHRYAVADDAGFFPPRREMKISSCASVGFTYSSCPRVNRNVTNRTETPSESLITVSLPQKLHSEVVAFQHRSGLNTLSEVIRHALDRYDDSRPSLETNRSRQVSFRVPSELRVRITRQARAARVSVGRIVRVALQALPSNPTTIQKKDIPMAKKKAAAKKSVKKATKAKKK